MSDEQEITKTWLVFSAGEKKYALLAGMHVLIKQYRLSDTETGTYQEAYQKIINDIKQANQNI